MKLLGIFLIGLIFLSFSMMGIKLCIGERDYAKVKGDIRKIKFYEGYDTTKFFFQEEVVKRRKCIGLFNVCLPSKDDVDNICIPYLKTRNAELSNPNMYEGQKILADTSGTYLKLVPLLKDLEKDFSKFKIDSIKREFLYGSFSEPVLKR